jgi:hypothetical protein
MEIFSLKYFPTMVGGLDVEPEHTEGQQLNECNTVLLMDHLSFSSFGLVRTVLP